MEKIQIKNYARKFFINKSWKGKKIGFCSTEQVTFAERKFAVSMRGVWYRGAQSCWESPSESSVERPGGESPSRRRPRRFCPPACQGQESRLFHHAAADGVVVYALGEWDFFLHAPLLDVWLVGHSHAGRVLQLSRWFYMGANTINKAAAATVAASRIFAVSCKNVRPN
jgi:hypothetical protein